MFALLRQKCLLLGLSLGDTRVNLLLDDLASRAESLIEVFLLLLHLVPQRQILLLDALDEDVAKLAHVLQLAFDALIFGLQLVSFLFEHGHAIFLEL